MGQEKTTVEIDASDLGAITEILEWLSVTRFGECNIKVTTDNRGRALFLTTNQTSRYKISNNE